MDPRIVLFVLVGLALAAAVVLEQPLKRLPLSLPILYVGLGWIAFALPVGLPPLDPSEKAHSPATEYLSEFIVIVSLMGAGLAIDRPLSWKNWRQVLPLLVVTMPLSIAAVGGLGWLLMGLTPAAAILLGAAMSPSDPVLAGAVQVGPPGASKRDDVRFNLTAEAGLNDGLAFPFVYLAISAASAGGFGAWLGEWAAWDGLWRIGAGAAVGAGIGSATGWLIFKRFARPGEEGPGEELERNEGLVVMALLFAAYGLAETIEGYGFIAVFVGAVAVRQFERKSEFHERTHSFIDQVEEVVLVGMLLAFGGLLASGVLSALTFGGAIIGVLILFVIRPLAGIVGMFGSGLPWAGRWAVAFLGIRGMGSIYYLAYAQNHADFGDTKPIWAAACFTILLSILVHGMVADWIMKRLETAGANVVPGTAGDVLAERESAA